MSATVVDLVRVRAAIAVLDALPRASLEGFTGRGPTEGEIMTGPTNQIGVRLPVELIERVDAYAQRLTGELPGANFNRTDAIRILLMQALETNDVQKDETETPNP